jgi:hypothetical protein
VNIKIRNAGYAPLYNERLAYIVLKNDSKTYLLKLAADPRRWLPNGVVSTINEQVVVPATVPTGTYQLYLYLPDAYSSLSANPAYAIRFANTNVWEASTGMNKLNATVTVTGESEPPTPIGEAILLPATLNKANVSEYSEDMTWYNSDYFDFGPEDGENTGRWAEWNVELRYPGKYIVSENMATASGTGHSWQLQLLDANSSPASTYTTEGAWAEGKITYDKLWDLTNVAKGVYTLRVQNVMEWGQPKLQYISLQYDGVLPTGIQKSMEEDAQTQAFDILGRPVRSSYQGIIIRNGRKTMQVRQ